MKVVLHESWDHVRQLSADWNRLLSQSSSDTIFLTWEWVEAWWNTYSRGRSPFVLSAWEGSELVGIAPLYSDTSRQWSRRWTHLRLIGDDSADSDYLDCFTKRGQEREIMAEFLEFLDEVPDRWDWIHLEGVPRDSDCLAAIGECAAKRDWKLAYEDIPCASLQLPDHWEKYLNTLRPRIRTKVRSSLAYFDRRLGLTPSECSLAGEIDAWLGQLFDLHGRRWATSNRPGVFREEKKRSFYRRVSCATVQKGWLAFHRLAWGDRTLALQYGFRYHGHYYVLQEGYDPSFRTLRPATALRAWILRDNIARGLSEYDFLAGTARHKLDWGAGLKVCRQVVLARKPAAAWISVSAPTLSRLWRERVRRVIPEAVLSRRRDWRVAQKQKGVNDSTAGAVSPSTRLTRWSASHLYVHTPFGAISRSLADRYTWQSDAGWSSRSMPVCTIFRYHRVNDDHDPFFAAVPVSQFLGQMEYLARHFHFVSLDQVASGELRCEGKRSCVAITFDDGYRDNFVHALPILRRMKIPATIFLTTGYVESGNLPWYDQVRLAFKLTVQSRFSLQAMGGPSLSLESEELRHQAMQAALAWLRTTHDVNRLRWLPELFRELRVPSEPTLPATMLSWNEIRQMSKEGISFGAHTVTHPVLGGLQVSQLEDEILGSKKTIENRLQIPVRHFAYPFGKPADFGRDAKRIVQAAGFQTAVTTIPGNNGPEQDPLELKRFSPDERDLGLFGLKLDWSRMFAAAG